jgi:hypothetical protein
MDNKRVKRIFQCEDEFSVWIEFTDGTCGKYTPFEIDSESFLKFVPVAEDLEDGELEESEDLQGKG